MGLWEMGPTPESAGVMFTVGRKVEVSFEKESLRDVWFPATILKNSGNDTFLVEYQQAGNGNEAIVHKVKVDYLHIRPSPPHLRDKNFVLLEKVDAYYDFGWWSGVITKELADNRYNVFFKHTKQEREFIYSRVRPHMEWKGGKWFNTSQGDSDVRTTRSLLDKEIDQTPPSIGKQSTVATLIKKRTNQANLDSNGKSSPPSKRLKDDTMIDTPSKRQKETSVGRSEPFDSEASVINDQAFSKTENLSHGKKVRSKRGKGIELDTPIMDSSRKRGRLANELKSLQNHGEGPKVDSAKPTQEINERSDATKDFPLPVVMGLQSNGMTVSQEKILQKLPSEIPDVAKGDTIQPIVLSVPLTAVDKAANEGDVASVAPKKKRGRPPKLQALRPETAVTGNRPDGGADPSAVSVGGDAQGKEVGLPSSSGSKLSEDNHTLPLTKDKLLQLPNENPEQDLSVRRGIKKKSSRKGKRGKRRTISINTESPALVSGVDSRDAPIEKADGSLENGSTQKILEASLDKSPDTVSNDQPLSRWFEGVQSHGPDGSMEQSSKESEKRMEIVAFADGETLPFVRSTPLWQTLKSMEAFQKIPQRPHFRPLLEGVKESAREGVAIGIMVMFSTVVDKTCGLKIDDPRSEIEDCLETLVELEDNGFDVNVIRERLTGLLGQKDMQDKLEEQSKLVGEKIKEHHKVQDESIDEEMEQINRQLRELEERRRHVLLWKDERNSEIGVMKSKAEKIEREMREVRAEFDRLAATPF